VSRCSYQVFGDREIRKTTTSFWDKPYAQTGGLMAPKAAKVLAVKDEFARRRDHPTYCFDGCAFPHAITPHQGDNFSL
jgi:hypothetical protein